MRRRGVALLSGVVRIRSASHRHTLSEAESAQLQQKRIYDDVLHERVCSVLCPACPGNAILGTCMLCGSLVITELCWWQDMFKQQLTRRNDEIALKDEKIKVQQATLAKGEEQVTIAPDGQMSAPSMPRLPKCTALDHNRIVRLQYRERLQDIRKLTIEAQELARQVRHFSDQHWLSLMHVDVLSSSVACRICEMRNWVYHARLLCACLQLAVRDHEVGAIDQLRNEVYHMQRELLEERTKVKALCEVLNHARRACSYVWQRRWPIHCIRCSQREPRVRISA